MKTAEEWMMQYGRTTEADLHIGNIKLDGRTVTILTAPEIRAIQADALRHAAELCARRATEDALTVEATRCSLVLSKEAERLEKGPQ